MTKRKQTEKQARASQRNFHALRVRGALAVTGTLGGDESRRLYQDNVYKAAWKAEKALVELLGAIQDRDNWCSVTNSKL